MDAKHSEWAVRDIICEYVVDPRRHDPRELELGSPGHRASLVLETGSPISTCTM